MCVELGVKLWPCEMTMELMGIGPDQFIDGVGERSAQPLPCRR